MRVAKRLVPVVESYGAKFDWQFAVVNNPQVNAFCCPGEPAVVVLLCRVHLSRLLYDQVEKWLCTRAYFDS